jgi:histidinol-phosphate aminotransferase
MPLLFNSQLASLPVYQPGRPIAEVARELGLDPAGVIKLASNENPLGPSPAALKALQDLLPSLHLYPDGNAFYLKQRLAAKLEIDPGQIVLGNGSNEVLEMVGHALLGPGTEAVVSEYCFAVYPIVTHLFGAHLINVPALAYGHDLPAMARAITPRTRVVFVANPNNPTGTAVSPEALTAFVRQVPDHVLLVLDEAYFEFLDQPADFLPLLRRQSQPNLLLVRTFSKIYGLAGLRLGYGIAHPQVASALEKIRQPFNINAAAQAAALAALDDTEHVERTRASNRAGLSQWEDGCRALGLEFVPSAANFVLIRVGAGAAAFAALQREGIITRPMAGYGLPEWLRISIGTKTENERGLAVLQAYLRTAPL